jgi:squalene synthase HpnC
VVTVEGAYASCERTARGHYENFPVASVLVPAPMRRHVAAIYAFARTADDFADEGTLIPAERHRLLDSWRDRVRAASGDAPQRPVQPGEPKNTHEIFMALAATIRSRDLPIEQFEALLSAFRQDVTVTSYETWDELMDYCRRSANPVGRLVLRVAGYRDDALDGWSDSVCTALQLANFWQDLGIDFNRGRLYVPAGVMGEHGARAEDLRTGVTAEWRATLADVAARTWALFEAGRPVCDTVSGRLRYELRATWLGGTRILEQLRDSGFDPIARRPRLGVTDAPWLAWRLLTWQPSLTAGNAAARGHL